MKESGAIQGKRMWWEVLNEEVKKRRTGFLDNLTNNQQALAMGDKIGRLIGPAARVLNQPSSIFNFASSLATCINLHNAGLDIPSYPGPPPIWIMSASCTLHSCAVASWCALVARPQLRAPGTSRWLWRGEKYPGRPSVPVPDIRQGLAGFCANCVATSGWATRLSMSMTSHGSTGQSDLAYMIREPSFHACQKNL